jgi:diacylglycerol kinase (ATP)
VTIAALLHPAVSPQAVERFQAASAPIHIQMNLEDAGPLDAALIFGGDGTVHRHLPELYQRQIPMLVVPKGSGNDFAKSLGITSQETAFHAWKHFFASGGKNVRAIDLGVVKSGQKEILFCCVAGAGMDSEAGARANRMPRWLRGSVGYVVAALQALAAFVPADFVVSSQERTIRDAGFFVAVGNAHRYGSGLKIAPRAALDDGLLDVCFIGRMNKLKLLCSVPTVFFGAHLGIKEVEYFQSPALSIESGRPLEVYADGEFACVTPVEVGLIRRALRVIVPAEAVLH